jgi:RHS repeat-associated protein
VTHKTSGGATVLTAVRTYERGALLDAITNTAGSVVSSHNYSNDAIGRRDDATLASGDKWDYGYNNRSEVTSAMKLTGTTPIAGYSHSYAFDAIGNRTASSREAIDVGYGSNSLNQITSLTLPDRQAGVLGTAVASSTVSITGTIPSVTGTVARTADNWWGVLDYSAASSPSDWKIDEWTATATLAGAGIGGSNAVAEESGVIELPPASRTPSYDLDGNTTSDGKLDYTWDSENRLVVIQTGTAAESAGVTPVKVECAYDWKGRRVKKLSYIKQSGTWSLQKEIGFGYDGWNLVCETGTTGAPTSNHVWGLDLSNTWQSAGGVGGLLSTSASSSSIPSFDGNGNIVAYVDASTGNEIALFEYGPFGELLKATGIGSNESVIGFSTKCIDRETGLLYYGYRFYQISLGRWISRDLIGEAGGINLNGFVENAPTSSVDLLGNEICVTTESQELLFFLDDGKTTQEKITAREAYKRKMQWFEPQASNFLKLTTVAPSFTKSSAVKHVSWDSVARFALTSRWSIDYRSGGPGDWKQAPSGGAGFLLVDVDGQPYWTDAVGQLPFAIDTTKKEMLRAFEKAYARDRKNFPQFGLEQFVDYRYLHPAVFERVLQIGKSHSSGNIMPGKGANEGNSYDIYMIIARGAKWALKKHAFKKYDKGHGRLILNPSIVELPSPASTELSQPVGLTWP